jgi:hypothetical protein
MGTHEGVSISDHTLQFVDFDIQKLFNKSETQHPISRYEREFTIFNTKKKTAFIDKLMRSMSIRGYRKST